MARVVAIEPCAAVDRELDAWFKRRSGLSTGDLAAAFAEMRGGRPAPG